MRTFGAAVGTDVYTEIRSMAQEIFDGAEPKRDVTAGEFAMEENPSEIVVHEVDLKWEGNRMRVAVTESHARPPFEWLLEITSDVGESDYFKHYLVREDDIVLAQRKVLTPVDDEEAKVILDDLKAARSNLA